MFSADFLCFSRVVLGFRRGKKSLVFGVVFFGFSLNAVGHFGRFCWAAAEGGGQNVSREFGGGGERTAEGALQNHSWRPQKLGLVWSVPLSYIREMTESCQKKGGGERTVGGRSKNVFGEGFYGMFSTPLSFPPPPRPLSDFGPNSPKMREKNEQIAIFSTLLSAKP